MVMSFYLIKVCTTLSATLISGEYCLKSSESVLIQMYLGVLLLTATSCTTSLLTRGDATNIGTLAVTSQVPEETNSSLLTTTPETTNSKEETKPRKAKFFCAGGVCMPCISPCPAYGGMDMYGGYDGYGGYPGYPAYPAYDGYGGYPGYAAYPAYDGYAGYGGYPGYPAYDGYGGYPGYPGYGGYGVYGDGWAPGVMPGVAPSAPHPFVPVAPSVINVAPQPLVLTFRPIKPKGNPLKPQPDPDKEKPEDDKGILGILPKVGIKN
ncbi:hypothetical protein GCK32_012064 [Trichostrongylus colubriformis]|uniref:Uncharacterized protein n=1 Tax=Trichostrongylus colubriformis TaxID=6319 RepID=A0AAN8ENM9_TRICO